MAVVNVRDFQDREPKALYLGLVKLYEYPGEFVGEDIEPVILLDQIQYTLQFLLADTPVSFTIPSFSVSPIKLAASSVVITDNDSNTYNVGLLISIPYSDSTVEKIITYTLPANLEKHYTSATTSIRILVLGIEEETIQEPGGAGDQQGGFS